MRGITRWAICALGCLALHGCTLAAALPMLQTFIAESTGQAAAKHATDPMEVMIYAAVATLLGGGGGGFLIHRKNGKKK